MVVREPVAVAQAFFYRDELNQNDGLIIVNKRQFLHLDYGTDSLKP